MFFFRVFSQIFSQIFARFFIQIFFSFFFYRFFPDFLWLLWFYLTFSPYFFSESVFFSNFILISDSYILLLFRGLASEDYVKLIWTTFAEFPGTILAFILIDWIGRKKTMAILSFLFAISTLGVIECQASKIGLIFLLFCSRGFATGLLQSVYVYTPEAYPTNLRAVALGKINWANSVWKSQKKVSFNLASEASYAYNE